jgi:hypothetical protein
MRTEGVYSGEGFQFLSIHYLKLVLEIINTSKIAF